MGRHGAPTHLQSKLGTLVCERLADAHGTRGFGVSPSGVCGQGPSVGMTLPGPLGGGLESLQTSSSGVQPVKRPRVGTSRSDPFAWGGPVSSVTPREAVDGSWASTTFAGQTGNSLAREPPVV